MRLLATVTLTILVGFSAASADELQCNRLVLNKDCLCAIPLESLINGQAAQLTEIGPPVEVTGRAGFTPVAQGVLPLFVNDSVMVQNAGSAVFTMGQSCSYRLSGNSSLVIREKDGCACASVVEIKPPPVLPIIPIIAGGGAAGGGVVLVTTLAAPGSEEGN